MKLQIEQGILWMWIHFLIGLKIVCFILLALGIGFAYVFGPILKPLVGPIIKRINRKIYGEEGIYGGKHCCGRTLSQVLLHD